MTPHETCFEFQLVEVKEKTNRPHKRETKILLYFSVIYTKSELNMTLKVSFWYNGCACGMNFVIYKFVFYFLVLWFRRYFHVPAENQIETRQFYYDIVTCLLFIPREKKKKGSWIIGLFIKWFSIHEFPFVCTLKQKQKTPAAK